MINLIQLLEASDQGSFYDWTRDFDFFNNSINKATESSIKRFKASLASKILNKSVIVRASKGYKQPKKDYTLKRVTAVDVNDVFDNWSVVLKNEFNKEFFLTAGFKIKILGASVAAEPGSAAAPQTPEPPTTPPVQQQKPQVGNPKMASQAQPQPSLGK